MLKQELPYAAAAGGLHCLYDMDHGRTRQKRARTFPDPFVGDLSHGNSLESGLASAPILVLLLVFSFAAGGQNVSSPLPLAWRSG